MNYANKSFDNSNDEIIVLPVFRLPLPDRLVPAPCGCMIQVPQTCFIQLNMTIKMPVSTKPAEVDLLKNELLININHRTKAGLTVSEIPKLNIDTKILDSSAFRLFETFRSPLYNGDSGSSIKKFETTKKERLQTGENIIKTRKRLPKSTNLEFQYCLKDSDPMLLEDNLFTNYPSNGKLAMVQSSIKNCTMLEADEKMLLWNRIKMNVEPLTKNERKTALQKYMSKKHSRGNSKIIRYAVRQNLAIKRHRVKGKFIKLEGSRKRMSKDEFRKLGEKRIEQANARLDNQRNFN